MKKCARCGSPLLETTDRCFTCGTAVQGGPEEAPPVELPVEPPDAPAAASTAPLNPYAPPQASLEAAEGSAEGTEMPLVAIPVGKVVGMSIVTWGLYLLVWHYRQWNRLKQQGDDVWPVPRAIFSGITFFSLHSRIQDKLRFHDCHATLAGGLAIAYLLASFLYRLPGFLALTGFLTVLPIAATQSTINELNRHLEHPEPTAKIGVGTLVAIVLGVLWWALALFGLFAGEV